MKQYYFYQSPETGFPIYFNYIGFWKRLWFKFFPPKPMNLKSTENVRNVKVPIYLEDFETTIKLKYVKKLFRKGYWEQIN